MTDWNVGDKAVCICDQFHISHKGERPILGAIYTVKEVFLGRRTEVHAIETGLRFLELPPLSDSEGYAAADFRKVVKDKKQGKKSICNKLDELFNQKADA